MNVPIRAELLEAAGLRSDARFTAPRTENKTTTTTTYQTAPPISHPTTYLHSIREPSSHNRQTGASETPELFLEQQNFRMRSRLSPQLAKKLHLHLADSDLFKRPQGERSRSVPRPAPKRSSAQLPQPAPDSPEPAARLRHPEHPAPRTAPFFSTHNFPSVSNVHAHSFEMRYARETSVERRLEAGGWRQNNLPVPANRQPGLPPTKTSRSQSAPPPAQ